MSQEEQEQQEPHQNLQYRSILKSYHDIGGVYQKFLRRSHIQSQTSNTD